jgi:hypothetical protein
MYIIVECDEKGLFLDIFVKFRNFNLGNARTDSSQTFMESEEAANMSIGNKHSRVAM